MRNIKKGFPFILFIIFILVVFLLLFTKPQDPSTVNQDAKNKIFSPTLTVESQEPSNSILVKKATLDKPGFIAAFKTMDKNIPDESNFAGVSGIIDGTKENIQVPLRETAKEGETYTVIIHVDDGDGIFEFPGDDQPSSFEDGTVNYVRTTIATPSAGLIPAK
jgi:hypothetical protein